MSSFDDRLDRRLRERQEAEANRRTAAEHQAREFASQADIQLQSTVEVRQWAARKLAESAVPMDELIDDTDVRVPWHRKFTASNEYIANVQYYERLKKRKGKRYYGWPIKAKGDYNFEFGKDSQTIVYLLADASIALVFRDHGRTEMRIISSPEEWRKHFREDDSFYRLSEEDFISAVEAKMRPSK